MATTDAAVHSDPWVPVDSFAARLVLVRHHLGLTQEQAAEQCGLDDGSWSNWERGRMPRKQADVAQAISDGLGVDRNWLIWGSTSGYNMTPLEVVEPGLDQPVQLQLIVPPALASV